MARKTVENTGFIDIQQLISLNHGDYKFTVQGIEGILSVNDDLFLIDNQIIYKSKTNVGYGIRYWFVCPGCRNNCKRLYKPSIQSHWLCRKCHSLTYRKSQLSGNEFKYITRQIRELQDELGVSKENYWPCFPDLIVDADIEWLPLYKPKHMRWETFRRKREQLELMIIRRVELWLQKVKL